MFIPQKKNVLHGRLTIENVKIKGEEFPDGPHDVNIIGISSYTNEQLTFIIQGQSGWIYTYVPTHYLTLGSDWITPHSTFVCPSIEFVITNPIVEAATLPEGKSKILFSVDFLDANEMLHCCSLLNGGGLLIYPHRKFVNLNSPKMKKMKSVWK